VGRKADDLDLLQRCIARAPGSWRLFVDRFAPTIKALAARFLRHLGHPGDDAASEDVVQEVFLALTKRDYKLLREYDPAYTVKTYLGVITRTEVHRSIRRKRPRAAGAEELDRAAPPQPDSTVEVERAEERDLVLAALESLPPRDAEILRLRFLREQDYKAIAAKLDIPEASVGQTLYRAKQRLLDVLNSRRPG
jgi:RNA polymerase sigma-70 factor (ECF subfamily)